MTVGINNSRQMKGYSERVDEVKLKREKPQGTQIERKNSWREDGDKANKERNVRNCPLLGQTHVNM